MNKHDNFLADAIKPRDRQGHLTYIDGFRFGFGFVIAHLLVFLVLGGVCWVMIAIFGAR